MKAKYIFFLFICIASFAVVSCVNRLDIEQHGVSTIDTFYQTDEDAEQALASVYYQLRSNYLGMGTDPIFIKTALSDEMWSGGGNHFDGDRYKFCDYTHSADLTAISTLFANYYKVVYLCNMIISNVADDTPFKKQAIAEAKALRALQYMDLILFWGTPRLVDHPLTNDEYLAGNTPTDELWAFVENDLNDAINSGALISKKTVNDDNNYHVTKEYAQALLGKAFITQEKYSEAASVFQGVIDSRKYKLATDLYNVWTPQSEGNGESLFDLNLLLDLNNKETTLRWRYLGIRSGKYVDFIPGKEVADDTRITDETWGRVNPTKSLYDAFVAIEGEDGYRRKCYIATYSELQTVYNKTIPEGGYVEDNEGFYNVKERVLAAYWESSIYPSNIHMMRLSEVYLLAAEAYFKLGNTAKATELLNAIRDRAQAPRISGVCTIDDIMNESFVELCFEGKRYENLIRWGIAYDVLKDKGSVFPKLYSDGTVEFTELTYSSEHGFKKGKHELLPFPISETSVNKFIVQNPNW